MDRRTLLLLGGGLALAGLSACTPRPSTPGPGDPGGPWTGSVTVYTWRPIENVPNKLRIDADRVTMNYDGLITEYPLDDARRQLVERLAAFLGKHPPKEEMCFDGLAATANLSNGRETVGGSYNCSDDDEISEMLRMINTIAPPVRDVWLGTITHRTPELRRECRLTAEGCQLSGSATVTRRTVPYTDALRARVRELVVKHPSPKATSKDYRQSMELQLRNPDKRIYVSAPDGQAYADLSALMDEIFR